MRQQKSITKSPRTGINNTHEYVFGIVPWLLHRPPSEQGRTVHCNSSYHRIVSGGGAEARTAPIQAMVRADRSGYSGDKGGACSSRGGGGGKLSDKERDRER